MRLADKSVDHLPDFLGAYAGGGLHPMVLDVTDRAATLKAMDGVKAVMCAVPYYFDMPMSEAAIETGAHFCDLGGNTDIVFQQKTLDAKARAAGVTVIPDCGLAPGMVNILAQLGISRCDAVESVKIFVGGLPQEPEPPLNYQVVYSLEGVLDYYTTLSWVIRDGKRHQVKALSERGRWSSTESVSSKHSTRRAPCPRSGSGTRGRSRRWSTRRSGTPGMRRSWKPFATLAFSTSRLRRWGRSSVNQKGATWWRCASWSGAQRPVHR